MGRSNSNRNIHAKRPEYNNLPPGLEGRPGAVASATATAACPKTVNRFGFRLLIRYLANSGPSTIYIEANSGPSAIYIEANSGYVQTIMGIMGIIKIVSS